MRIEDHVKDLFTKRQRKFLKENFLEEPRITLLDGSVGSGKTKVLLFAFLFHLNKYKGMDFIIGGATIATIQRNFLTDLEHITGIKVKLDKHNSFEFLGNRIWCFEGRNSDAWKKVRGMNSAGSMLGELTTLNKRFVNEVENRTRKKGARLFYDTNPDHEQHWVKLQYVNNSGQRLSSGRLNIFNMSFKIEDNTYLPAEYVESLKATTPPGVLYDRNILGIWSSETMASIYGAYLKEPKIFTFEPRGPMLYAALDLGIADSTSIVFATMIDRKLYVLDHYMASGLPTKHYIEKILEVSRNMGYTIPNIHIILPHDSAKREDSIRFITSRYAAYAEVFRNITKLPAIRVHDNINCLRFHLHNQNIYFKHGLTDFLSRLRLYSWKVDSDGNIDSTTPEHGREWDAPSNVADSLEYLTVHVLGMPDFNGGGSSEYYKANDFKPYTTRSVYG